MKGVDSFVHCLEDMVNTGDGAVDRLKEANVTLHEQSAIPKSVELYGWSALKDKATLVMKKNPQLVLFMAEL